MLMTDAVTPDAEFPRVLRWENELDDWNLADTEALEVMSHPNERLRRPFHLQPH